MGSLRDMGYSIESAVADLVDNSIDAGARTVDVDLVFEGAESWLRVADDGCGMTPQVLDEAMRYGTRRDYGSRDLGRYGLGLKTASLSQCRRLSVATRIAPERARVHARCWDLDHVEAVDEWQLLDLGPLERDERLTNPLAQRPGTVVLWEQLDRILGYRRPESGAGARGIAATANLVREHLAMIFHRFLSGEAGRPSELRLFVNGEEVTPWDPFARDEVRTRRLAQQHLRASGEDSRLSDASIRVQPYILPSQSQFSTPFAHTNAGGPRRWNRQQGLYVYLRDRLVQSGGWSRLRAEDEHTKLARIAIDVPEGLEHLFAINVSKMRVTIPEDFRHSLQALVSGVSARAREAYHAHSGDPAEARDRVESDVDYIVVTDDVLTVETVATVLVRTLEDHPALLRSILAQLGLDILDERPSDAVDIAY